MTLDDFRTLFIASCLGFILLSGAGLLSPFLSLPRSAERFSELWVLGPGRMAEDYPFNVRSSEPYLIYLGVRNHLGGSAYYAVRVKFRTQLDPLPNQTSGEPSRIPGLYEFRFFLVENGTWEMPLTFEVLDVEHSEVDCSVGRLRLNGEALPVWSVSSWDEERKGFYHELFFELWLFDEASGVFQYHNRFVGIWLNVTR